MSLPNGTTVRVHIDWSMAQVEALVQSSFAAIRQGRKLKPAVRRQLWRDLAGVVGDVESIRVWLDKGAPE